MKSTEDLMYLFWKNHKTIKNAKIAFLHAYMEDPTRVPIDLSNAVVDQMVIECDYENFEFRDLYTDAVEVELRVDNKPEGTTKQSMFKIIADEYNADPARESKTDSSNIRKSYYSRKANLKKNK